MVSFGLTWGLLKLLTGETTVDEASIENRVLSSCERSSGKGIPHEGLPKF
jgi:hypothetical protein